MHLINLQIEGFRGVSSLRLDDFKTINVLVGKNNSSKTTVLESIFLLLGMSDPGMILRINNQRDLLLNETDDLRFVFHNLDFGTILKINGDFDRNNHHRELVIEPVKNSSNSKIINGKTSGYESNQTDDKVDQLILHASVKELHKPKKNFDSKLTYNQGKFSIESAKDYSENIRGVLLPPRWAIASNLEKGLENLIVTKQLSSILNVLNKVDSAIQGLSLGSNGLVFVDIGLQRLVPINLLGDGIRRLLTILLTMSDAKDGIVLIDEIDNGLHFSAQKTLWKAMLEGTKQYNVQLFCTTHNYETLKNLAECVGEENGFMEKIRSYTLRKVGTETLSYKYDYEKLGFAIQQGIEFR